MKIIRTNLLGIIGAEGLTLYPYIFLKSEDALNHEKIHYHQQEKWYKKAWYFGIAAWVFVYLLCLPVGWNPFRYKFEYEAYLKGDNGDPKLIRLALRRAPHYLWFH